MKTIGIKLADGTFYPVLEEGQACEKTIELTTAHNNQTRVMVDLYRTKTGTMEDAEYVDTLQIDHLVKHPSGDSDISFAVSLDENNELSARIIDNETGATSKTTIELINRTLEERLGSDPTETEYEITEPASEESEEIVTDEIISDENVTEEPYVEPTVFEETVSENSIAEETITEDFDLPDFEESPELSPQEPVEEPVIEETSINEDFDLPDFGDTFADSVSEETPLETPAEDFFSTDDMDDVPAAGGLNFDGLYDDETDFEEEEEVTKKTRTPVIICVVCAIICIIAVLLILFVIPSKLNILNKGKNTELVETVEIIPEPVKEPEPEPVPSAKEDEIVIIEKAEEVKPEPPAPPVAETKPDIVYKIKWGDTLWDIADTYYKNPWRYKKIANYNRIKNPDYIISGTTILIPQE